MRLFLMNVLTTGAHIIEIYWFIGKRRAQATIAVYVYNILYKIKNDGRSIGSGCKPYQFKRNQPSNTMKQTTEMWIKYIFPNSLNLDQIIEKYLRNINVHFHKTENQPPIHAKPNLCTFNQQWAERSSIFSIQVFRCHQMESESETWNYLLQLAFALAFDFRHRISIHFNLNQLLLNPRHYVTICAVLEPYALPCTCGLQ